MTPQGLQFIRGQVFEGVVGGLLRSAKVIAIVDGGRIGWLEFLDTKGEPFELDRTQQSGWRLVEQAQDFSCAQRS